MCGRYSLTSDPRELEQRFGLTLADLAGTGRYNVAPSEDILAVVRERSEPAPRARLLSWGLRPHWEDGSRKLINARSETVARSPAFRTLVAGVQGRCLILADGFYEWQKPEDPGGPRTPFRFTVDGGAPFALAGLHTRGTATILTTVPNPLVARLHDRMPVILADEEAEAAWLGEGVSGEEALALCTPLDPARMSAAAVSRRLNASGLEHEGPELLEPDPPAAGDAPPLKLF